MTAVRLVATPAVSVLVPFHLRRAPSQGIDLVVFDSVAGLAAQLTFRTLHAVLVELRSDAGYSPGAVIGEVRRTFHGCPIIAVVRALTRDRDLVPSAIAAGATDLALIGYEDLASCVWRATGLATRVARLPEEEVLSAIQPHIDLDVWPFMAYAVQTATHGLSVDQFAAGFGLSSAALSRRVRKHGLKSTGALMSIARALVAATLLQRRTACVTSVAESLRFGTVYAFRLFLRKQFGARPDEIRRGPTVAHAVARLTGANGNLACALAPSDLLREIATGARSASDSLRDPTATAQSA